MVRELSGKEILAIYTPPDTFSVSEVTEIIPGFRVKIFDLLTFVAPSEYDAKVKEIKESLEKNGLSIDTVMIEPGDDSRKKRRLPILLGLRDFIGLRGMINTIQGNIKDDSSVPIK